MAAGIASRVKSLIASDILRLPDRPITTDEFEVYEDPPISPEFGAFLTQSAGYAFDLSNLEFCIYPGLAKKNLNQWYAWYEDQVFKEYEQAHAFASSGKHDVSLGVDLSSNPAGAVFLYCDSGHGTDDRCYYLAETTEKFLDIIESGQFPDFEYEERRLVSRSSSGMQKKRLHDNP